MKKKRHHTKPEVEVIDEFVEPVVIDLLYIRMMVISVGPTFKNSPQKRSHHLIS
jgi:hypothetical protein